MKKRAGGVAALLLALFLPVAAAEIPDIDAQIERIKQAPPQERRELMNRFKEQLARMNARQREEAISRLRHKLAPNANPASRHSGAGASEGRHGTGGDSQMRQSQRMGERHGMEQYLHGSAHSAGAPQGGAMPPRTGAEGSHGTPAFGGGGHAPGGGRR